MNLLLKLVLPCTAARCRFRSQVIACVICRLRVLGSKGLPVALEAVRPRLNSLALHAKSWNDTAYFICRLPTSCGVEERIGRMVAQRF